MLQRLVEESETPHYLGWIFGALVLAIAFLGIAIALPTLTTNPYQPQEIIRQ